LIARLQRHLAKDGELIRKSRSLNSVQQNGLFFVVNSSNHVKHSFPSFEALVSFAREIEALQPWETIEKA
jgi:hypothetical protein